MPRRPSTQKNNMLNYFSPSSRESKDTSLLDSPTATPKRKGVRSDNDNDSAKKKPCIETFKSNSDNEQEETEEMSVSQPEEASPEHDPDSGEDSDYNPVTASKKRSNQLIDSDTSTDSSDEPSSDESPIKKKSGKKPVLKKRRLVAGSDQDEESTPKKKVNAVKVESFKFSKTDESFQEKEIVKETKVKIELTEEKVWPHTKLKFLNESRRDINKNTPDHPDFDEKTVFVPNEFLNSLTPAMKQWWIFKGQHFDTILFFKVGKFYELYHMDAVVGVNNLGLHFMKGDFAHSGFPEIAFSKMATALAEQNFRVARVEQTETPEMMAERCRQTNKKGKHDKVVRREICEVLSKTTRVYGGQLLEPKQQTPCYMTAVAENVAPNGTSTFGVCFIDTSIGIFHVGEFKDDHHCSKLLSLFAEYPPGLVLTEKGCLAKSTATLLKKCLGSVQHESLVSKVQFYPAQRTIDVLMEGCYFRNQDQVLEWPVSFNVFLENGTFKPQYSIAFKALGACVWYLKNCELDVQVLCMKKFELYEPTSTPTGIQKNFMVLDSLTIEHLELLGPKGTLQSTIDLCKTPSGKRLLQSWICRPLCVYDKILERQEIVKALYCDNDVRQKISNILKKLPDLERQVSQIHVYGNKFYAEEHPNSRAILYEAKTYSRGRIRTFINTLKGFEKAQELATVGLSCSSELLQKLICYPPKGNFEDLTEILNYFEHAFDHQKAEHDGKIIPTRGVVKEYDNIEDSIEKIKSEVDSYLKEQEKFFGCKLKYFGAGKKRYQLEIPDSHNRKINSDYRLEGCKKGNQPAKRYTTDVTRDLLYKMTHAEETQQKFLDDVTRRIFEKFSNKQKLLDQVIDSITTLDIYCAFAEYASICSHPICFPTILPFQKEALIQIEDGVHPCTLLADFVPNDTILGTETKPRMMLLSGPNMGGKSTLMRQIAVIAVMCQMGCPIPASSCTISLIDRVFTRMGASDNIIRGQSTFLVELSEARSILQHATVNSLVLLDELGRGTCTHDGNAIATAYVKKLIDINCRTVFSTHYHTLVDNFLQHPKIQLGHMACMTNEEEDNVDQLSATVTLLYKLRKGRCPKSFGFVTAKQANLNNSIIQRAFSIARDNEMADTNCKLFCDLFISGESSNLRSIMKQIKNISLT